MEKYKMFINGHWEEGVGKEKILVINPASEEVVASVPKGGAEDAEKAVTAAAQAQKKWSALTAIERASIIKRTVKRIALNKAYLAEIIVKEQGKPYADALGEVEGTMCQPGKLVRR